MTERKRKGEREQPRTEEEQRALGSWWVLLSHTHLEVPGSGGR